MPEITNRTFRVQLEERSILIEGTREDLIQLKAMAEQAAREGVSLSASADVAGNGLLTIRRTDPRS